MSLEWLRSPLICNGRVVRPALQPESVTDADLPDICLRMQLILATIEDDRCEGRLIDVSIFDPIDTMESGLRFEKENYLADWCETIRRFAEYYNLDGKGPIEVSPKVIDERTALAKEFGIDLTEVGE